MAAMMHVANALRRIGQKNSPGGQDSHLVYVNDQELSDLYAKGGAGVRDPQTGILHFYDPDARDANHGNDSESEGSDSATGRDGSLGGSDSGKDIGGIMDAELHDLCEVDGMGENSALLLKLMRDLCVRYLDGI